MRQKAQDVLDTIIENKTPLFFLAVLGFLMMIVFFLPTLSSKTHYFLKNLRDTGKRLFSRPILLLWTRLFVSHLLLWGCQGIAFIFFLKSLSPVQWKDAYLLTACFAFAWFVGFLSFLTPGGLGIREGLLGLLLANYMPDQQTILVALICRAWMLSAEIILAAFAFFLNRKSNSTFALSVTII